MNRRTVHIVNQVELFVNWVKFVDVLASLDITIDQWFLIWGACGCQGCVGTKLRWCGKRPCQKKLKKMKNKFLSASAYRMAFHFRIAASDDL